MFAFLLIWIIILLGQEKMLIWQGVNFQATGDDSMYEKIYVEDYNEIYSLHLSAAKQFVGRLWISIHHGIRFNPHCNLLCKKLMHGLRFETDEG